jgi:hypothetical protein
MKIRKPKVGTTVNFIMEKGIREAKVTQVWTRPDDIHILAERYGTSPDEQEEAHRLRVTLVVETLPEDGLPIPFTVSNALHSEKNMLGTWHFKP